MKSSGTSTPVQCGVGSKESSSGTSSIIFTSPFEDTSGLDVFAQIAASAHPLPVVRRSSTSASTGGDLSINTSGNLSAITSGNTSGITSVTTSGNTYTPISSSSNNIVQQSQSQLAQSIYQSQQALRLQQKRDSIDSTTSKFDPKIEDDNEEEEGFYSDDDDEDMEFDSDSSDMRYKFTDQKNNSKSSLLFDTSIKEETESDLMMDVDPSMNVYHQRLRSPSLSTESNDLNMATNTNNQMYARRLSAPENSTNACGSGGFSARRVVHNICERKRRENIRDGFAQLQNRLPSHLANNPKLSKMEILAGSRNLINDIRGRISNLSAEISALSLVSEQIEKTT